jgi:tetraacyldisaccharide 4'-kinase
LPPSRRSADILARLWRGRGPGALLLSPLAFVFAALARMRRAAYRAGWLAVERLPVPVVVVGNIVAGGAGKTPLTLWLAQRLRAAGRRPGIVSRGYGRDGRGVLEVKVGAGGTVVEAVGDEPLLLARRSGCPVFVGADRAAAARALLAAYPDRDLILCDDGLQHYRLARDIEIAVVDRRGLMNGLPMPAGPLREPVQRLGQVDALVLNDAAAVPADGVPAFRMRLEGARFHRLGDPSCVCVPEDLHGQKLHAVAGIGEPQRFFDHLAALGLQCAHHAFPDHHRYVEADFDFDGDAILMTEKDALKCGGLAAPPIWVLPVEAKIEPDLARFVLDILEKNHDGPASA